MTCDRHVIAVLDEIAVVGFEKQIQLAGLRCFVGGPFSRAGRVAPNLTLSRRPAIGAGEQEAILAVPDSFAAGETGSAAFEESLITKIVIGRFDVLNIHPLDIQLLANGELTLLEVSGVRARQAF